ncbi:MAG: MFS transporter [Proteobacteria bacterium]|nr:MFS transporter [Pseudomonadota bacterium]
MGQKNTANATLWPGVITLVIVGVLAAAQLGKIPPLVDELAEDLSLSLFAAGWATSVITLIGAILGVSAGSLLGMLDMKRALMAALLLAVLASAAGGFAVGKASLLAVRVVEGISYLVITVACPALIASSTDDRDRSLALALWSCFVPLGFALINFLAPWMVAAGSWRTVFWINAAALLAIFIAAGISHIRCPAPNVHTSLRHFFTEHAEAYCHRSALVIALSFLGCVSLHVGFLAFLPAFLSGPAGLSRTDAGMLSAVASLAYIPGALVTAWLHRRGVAPLLLGTSGFAVMVGAAVWAYDPTNTALVLATAGIALSIGAGMVGSVCFAAAPYCAPHPHRVRLVNGLLAQFGSIGVLVTPPIFARIVEISDWPAVRMGFYIVGPIGGALLWIVRSRLGGAGSATG